MPANILNLPRLTVTQVDETDHDYHIKAQASTDPTACPECKHVGLVGFGRNEQLIKDLPMHGKRVGIYFDTRRFRCKECGKTFLEKHPDFHTEAKKRHWASHLSRAQRNAIQGERNATKASATPSWLTKEDRKAIAAVYAESAMLTAQTGVPHEVDHIVPLRSKVVCGLHVAWNLRAIPAHKNRQKSNLFEVAE